MAGFRTHITVSTVLGAGYGAAGLAMLPRHEEQIPLATCLLATGLCSLSGMLPDVDSDSGIPFRETMALSAAIAPMLMLSRFEQLGLGHESMVLAGGLVYFLVRFGVGGLLRRFTVHRGMFHSLPAAMLAGAVAYLLCSCSDPAYRYYKAGAVVLGYVSHLVVDELWSIEWRYGRLRLKKSFGTAMKLWGENRMANVATYAGLLLLVAISSQDDRWMHEIENRLQDRQVPKMAIEALQNMWR